MVSCELILHESAILAGSVSDFFEFIVNGICTFHENDTLYLEVP